MIVLVFAFAVLPVARAGQFDLPIPSNSGSFGTSVTVLPNGNFVVTDPGYDAPGPIADVGAVYLYDGVTLVVISTLTGSTGGDLIGIDGVTVLSNGNYVVRSGFWNGQRGAVTWGSGTSGVTGAVSAANSLVGSTANEQIGVSGVAVLANGNYVVRSGLWNGSRGAVTWGNGTSGVAGVVSAANSLVGSTANDGVGGVTALANGNYVVSSVNWDNGAVVDAGAATWGNGTTGVTGVVSSANSLVGSTASDGVGSGDVTVLANGNYVVSSANWDNGAVTNAGAATWGSGTNAVTGAVSSANSLVGSTANDFVGAIVTVLSNGNYVVGSPFWNNGAVADAGAATWGSGTTGVTGTVSAVNSLVGSTANDQIGYGGVTALANGNYVVRSPLWDGLRGAATWGSGTSGVTGAVSAVNSLVGSTPNDLVGIVTALANGNYVVSSSGWNGGRGAATWGNGTSGVAGALSSANSLVGSTASDGVGSGGVTALANGNYVVRSTAWDNGAQSDAGAVTWGNGTSGVTGTVSSANSLVGSRPNDLVGGGAFGSVTALSNGDYVVRSPNWDRPSFISDEGAVSLGSGSTGVAGVVSATNSVLGTILNGGSTMNFTYDFLNTRLLVGYPADNRVSVFGYTPEIVVQQPLNVNLADGATRIFSAPAGTNASITFTIKNTNVGSLTGLGITVDGSDASLFTVTASPTAPVSGPFGSTTFTVRFAPTTTGAKTAALHIANNDSDENLFDINLSGQVLLFTQDTDGDGLSDAAEFDWGALGLDWQVSQPSLVSTFFTIANSAGLYTTNQVQALNVGTPLLIRNPQTGQFTLTIAVQKSTDLISFAPFPMTAPQTTINGQGNLEFQFTVPDNAAFFRLQAQ